MGKKFKNKAIITCVVTGAMHTPTMSDYLPCTPEEIAKESLASMAVAAYWAILSVPQGRGL